MLKTDHVVLFCMMFFPQDTSTTDRVIFAKLLDIDESEKIVSFFTLNDITKQVAYDHRTRALGTFNPNSVALNKLRLPRGTIIQLTISEKDHLVKNLRYFYIAPIELKFIP